MGQVFAKMSDYIEVEYIYMQAERIEKYMLFQILRFYLQKS